MSYCPDCGKKIEFEHACEAYKTPLKNDADGSPKADSVRLSALLGRTKREASEYYARLIMGGNTDNVELVNAEIKIKWSEYGLRDIKRMAWKIVDEHERNYNCDLVSFAEHHKKWNRYLNFNNDAKREHVIGYIIANFKCVPLSIDEKNKIFGARSN